MAVQWHRATRFNLNKVNGVIVGMYQFRKITRGYFFSWDIGELLEDGGIHKLKV
jgi:hypothetical protein